MPRAETQDKWKKRNMRKGPQVRQPTGTSWLLFVVGFVVVVSGGMASAQNLISMPQPQPNQQQHNNILQFSVNENAPNLTWVGNIRSSDGQIPYVIVPLPQTPEHDLNNAFSVNTVSGDIFTNSVLDREFREQYQFVAIVREPFAEIKCTVTVKDVNDNQPMFLMPQNETNYVIDLPEGQRGIRAKLPMAVDFDSPQIGIKEFRITSVHTPPYRFLLVERDSPARKEELIPEDPPTPISSESLQLQQQIAQQATVLVPSQPIMQFASSSPQHSRYLIDLEVNHILDRENQSSYQLIIEAIDGGQPPMMGKLMVTVNVLDVNDNDPIFNKKLYECHIKEDATKRTLLSRVLAHDNDSDANGQISYSIKRHTSSSQPNINLINNSSSSDNLELSTGRFITSTNTNTNTNSNANKQQRNQQQLAQTTSTATSTNKLIQRSSSQASSSNEIYDNASADSAFKTKLSSYNTNAPEQMFEIDPVKGEVYLVSQLDYETDQMHELLIEARDHGKPSRASQTILKIYVMDVNDELTPSGINRLGDDRRQPQMPSSEPSRSELTVNRLGDLSDASSNYFQNFILNWFAQINAPLLFVFILVGMFVMSLSVCVYKTRSRQPDSDYNDTAGLTLTSNNGQTKQSPNHSISYDHSNSSNENHHRHDHQRRTNGSFGALNGSGFDSIPSGKLRYPHEHIDANPYINIYPEQQPRYTSNHLQQSDSPSNHQMATGGGSARTTMTLHDHQALLNSTGGHHSLEHHQYSGGGGSGSNAHHSSSLTYTHHHSRAALLHQAHHHQSSHHLSSVHHGHNKGGTMNSVGTHHSAHPSTSPLPATPNTTHSSGLPANLHDSHHGHGHNPLLPMPPLHSIHQQPQLPPTPCNVGGNIFSSWPHNPGSTLGCFPGSVGPIHGGTSGSSMDCTPSNTQPLDRWFDLGVSSQLVYAHDWYGSYNWDYLTDWVPDYHNVMPLIKSDACGY